MSLLFDPMAARQRHEEMLKEAAQTRLVRMATKANGTQPSGIQQLLSRMVKLLSRSNSTSQNAAKLEKTINQHQLA